MLERIDRVSEVGKFVQNRHTGRGFQAVLGRAWNIFRIRARSKSFFSSLLKPATIEPIIRENRKGSRRPRLLEQNYVCSIYFKQTNRNLYH